MMEPVRHQIESIVFQFREFQFRLLNYSELLIPDITAKQRLKKLYKFDKKKHYHT